MENITTQNTEIIKTEIPVESLNKIYWALRRQLDSTHQRIQSNMDNDKMLEIYCDDYNKLLDCLVEVQMVRNPL
jgi:hypothetical protein